MVTGAAVVVSDSGALPEIVRGAGLVFPAGNDAALADRLVALVRSPELRRRLGRAARLRVEERYTLDQRVARLAGLCAELTARPGADRVAFWRRLALRRGVLS
jgi:glycosyltransferase involved in cell wall biosynthesis